MAMACTMAFAKLFDGCFFFLLINLVMSDKNLKVIVKTHCITFRKHRSFVNFTCTENVFYILRG